VARLISSHSAFDLAERWSSILSASFSWNVVEYYAAYLKRGELIGIYQVTTPSIPGQGFFDPGPEGYSQYF
jgi:hypothetical protein